MNFIIVLGSSNDDKRRRRVEKAVSYYNHLLYDQTLKDSAPHKRGINSFSAYDELYSSVQADRVRIIFSGKGKLEGMTEADDMRRIAVVELGVPEKVCIVETESQNTHQNIVNTLHLLQQQYSWFNPTFYSSKPIFTLCTSHFHAARSLVIGMDVLSEHGYVNIIHTCELIPTDLANQEKEVLNHYITNYMLPKKNITF